MKKIRASISNWEDKLEKRWEQLSLKRQRKIIAYIFLGYTLSTVAMIAQVWFQAQQSDKDIQIEHIRNPLIDNKKSATSIADSISVKLKKSGNERK